MAKHFHINNKDIASCGCGGEGLLEQYKDQKERVLAALRDMGLESPRLRSRTLIELKEMLAENQ